MKVFIDGENLRHRLVSVFHQEQLIGDTDDMFQADIRELVVRALGEDPESISYYTTRIKHPKFEIPELLTQKIATIQESHRRWIAMLTNQGIRVVKAGNLKVKESNACYHCGRRTMLLQEKGVDVRLASEIVMAAVHDNVNDIVVLSSDADMIPALNIARRGGAHITYLCFGEETNDALVKVCDRTVAYTREQIIHAFRGLQPRKTHNQEQYHEHREHEEHEQHHEGHGEHGEHHECH